MRTHINFLEALIIHLFWQLALDCTWCWMHAWWSLFRAPLLHNGPLPIYWCKEQILNMDQESIQNFVSTSSASLCINLKWWLHQDIPEPKKKKYESTRNWSIAEKLLVHLNTAYVKSSEIFIKKNSSNIKLDDTDTAPKMAHSKQMIT